jgi:hypothetical protein
MMMTRREGREVRYTLEKYEKRSKNITITYKRTYGDMMRMDIEIKKENKVTDEMLAYLHTLCYFHEAVEYGDRYYSEWFRNYDDLATEELFYYGMEIVVNFK